jgi:acetoin utilization protein AcuB
MKHPKRAITREIRRRQPKRPGRTKQELEALTWPERIVRVGDLMAHNTVAVRDGATVGQAWKLMQSRRIRHLPVLDRDGRLIGIVTDRDLRQVILEPALQEELGNLSRALNILTVGRVMTWGVVSVRPATDIRHAAQIMREQRISALPVVDGSRLVGMFTASDVIRAFVELLGEGVLSKPERWRAREG